MSGWAIIFDVDGVLLELTRDEEELFFAPFASRVNADALSRDWNSYRIRNDEDITREIVDRHSLPASEAPRITAEYLALLEAQLNSGKLRSVAISGAARLLGETGKWARLGIATANFHRAAALRLAQAGLWAPVAGLAFGADGGGAKSAILARAIAACGLAPSRIIFIGDNLNDVAAGFANNVHFIGFSENPERRAQLAKAGAQKVSGNHEETLNILKSILGC